MFPPSIATAIHFASDLPVLSWACQSRRSRFHGRYVQLFVEVVNVGGGSRSIRGPTRASSSHRCVPKCLLSQFRPTPRSATNCGITLVIRSQNFLRRVFTNANHRASHESRYRMTMVLMKMVKMHDVELANLCPNGCDVVKMCVFDRCTTARHESVTAVGSIPHFG